MQENTIRNAVRAIIIEDGKILLCKYSDDEGDFFACIGGGQDYYEDMHSALARECKEEINCEIDIGKLVFVREAFIKGNEENGDLKAIHQIEYFFKCSIQDNQEVRPGDKPDLCSLGIEWVSIEQLNEIRIYPNLFKEYIHIDGSLQDIIYLGFKD